MRPCREIGAGTERVAGVAEHHGPHRRVVRGITQALMQLADQRGRQRVAVVWRIQRQPRHMAVDAVFDYPVHQ
ncbi:hypothetical protein GCM10009641_48120 [Mycobacterium cookii]|uniref:Uncharacterized protein n=1 Tax=Mycobacterium cookii TaxID=1775 RepID=A0A7I7KWV4_9MYCO|nr:hypothetical protein MCOO_22410 [Mycobacterium cookii]